MQSQRVASIEEEASQHVSYLSQAEAQDIDEELMSTLGFSLDQLMELAGLSVACAIAEVYGKERYARVLVVCGPGNNGGDGLVAARHLSHFGYAPSVCYPKRTDKPIYKDLVTQLESLGVPFVDTDAVLESLHGGFDLVVDAMFGFSFHGMPRPPFDAILRRLAPGASAPPVASVDVPSGWHVEEGDVDGTGLRPEMLVSLTAPKKCALKFEGPYHYLGGRFVPPAIRDKYHLRLPPYPGTALCVALKAPPPPPGKVDVAGLRLNYTGRELLESQVAADPFDQFRSWFEEAVAGGVPEPNEMTLATATPDGRPSARQVLLKGYDKSGFVWYTNYGSRKSGELLANGRAALVFSWGPFHRSVRIEGPVEKVSSEESDAYYHSRPRGSQLGAHVSPQSSVIEGRHVLDERARELLERFPEGKEIPRPEGWGGFRLRPERIEFWQGRESRLHDRLLYSKAGEGESPAWKIERLAP